jgi:hypothetical protein
MTASTLYEAVEPNIIWKQLLTSIVADMTSDSSDLEVRERVVESRCEKK